MDLDEILAQFNLFDEDLEEALASVDSHTLVVPDYNVQSTAGMSFTRDIPGIFSRLGIDTNKLYIMPLQEYIERAEELSRVALRLSGEADHLQAFIRNVVMITSLDVHGRDQNIDCLFYNLSDFGYLGNKRKFRSAYITYGGALNVKLTLYKGATSIDCKGANDLLTIYIAIEIFLAHLRDSIHDGNQDAFTIRRNNVINIVASCNLDFGVPCSAILNFNPNDSTTMRTDKKKDTKTSAAQFEGGMFRYVIGDIIRDNKNKTLVNRILFQEGLRAINSVGCCTTDDVVNYISRFYSVANQARQQQMIINNPIVTPTTTMKNLTAGVKTVASIEPALKQRQKKRKRVSDEMEVDDGEPTSKRTKQV